MTDSSDDEGLSNQVVKKFAVKEDKKKVEQSNKFKK